MSNPFPGAPGADPAPGGKPPIFLPVPTRVGASDPDDPANLHVVAVLFNHNRSVNLVANFERFVAHMRAAGVTLHVVELVRGSLPFEVTLPGEPLHLQLRSMSEFFQKENLIKLGVANALRLFPDLEYLAWFDADVTFFNADMARSVMRQLNRHPVVQAWAMACDLGPDGHPMVYPGPDGAQVAKSFGYCYANGLKLPAETKRWGYEWHTGYAWAMRRDTWEALGGLYDRSIMGSADTHMAWAFVGKIGWGLVDGVSKGWRDDVVAWCEQAWAVVRGDVGYVDGLIHHHWHGRKTDRRYVGRLDIPVRHAFDPRKDLWYDARGLLHLTDDNPELRREVRAYMAQRNDDCNTLG